MSEGSVAFCEITSPSPIDIFCHSKVTKVVPPVLRISHPVFPSFFKGVLPFLQLSSTSSRASYMGVPLTRLETFNGSPSAHLGFVDRLGIAHGKP